MECAIYNWVGFAESALQKIDDKLPPTSGIRWVQGGSRQVGRAGNYAVTTFVVRDSMRGAEVTERLRRSLIFFICFIRLAAFRLKAIRRNCLKDLEDGEVAGFIIISRRILMQWPCQSGQIFWS
jgi:hypothetical protein